MTSRKRNTIFGIALGLAIAAIAPMTALAKPVPANQDVQDHGSYQLGPGEIPVLSPALRPSTTYRQSMEVGISEGKARELGLDAASRHRLAVAKGPDDRAVSRATTLDTSPSPVVISDGGRSVDINAYTVTGFGFALLLAIGFGMGVAVWQSRRTKLSLA